MKKKNSIFFIAIAFVILGAVLMSGCVSKEIAQEGDTVSVTYYGTLDDGTVFDHNVGGNPFTITLGEHQAIPGFENAIYGMSVGEKKTVRIAPEDAYQYDPAQVVSFDRDEVESAIGNVTVGQGITVSGFPGIITEVTSDSVVIDFNLEISGQYLTFEITILEITKAK